MSRPAVTDVERKALKTLIAALSPAESFYCSGLAEYAGLVNPSLVYLVEGGGKAMRLDAADEVALGALHQDSDLSHFGQGLQRVMDESYRLARELVSNRIAMNFDPLAEANGILQTVSAFCKKGVDIRLYKLNSYVTDGFFRLHKDTPKAENHIGTLLIGLPFAFTGGELLLNHGSGTATIDWSNTHLTASHGGKLVLPWVFFYSDVKHEILPVMSGHRVTLAFDVYSSRVVAYQEPDGSQANFDVRDTKFFGGLQRFLENPGVFPDGARLAFGLNYTYPFGTEIGIHYPRGTDVAALTAKLKGTDIVLYRSLKESGLEIEVKAVYKENYGYTERYCDDPVDEFTCLIPNDGPGGQTSVLMTSRSFTGVYEGCMIEGGDPEKIEALRTEAGAEIELDVVWVDDPEGFNLASTYIGYGNEPIIKYCYVAAAFMVDVPQLSMDGRREM